MMFPVTVDEPDSEPLVAAVDTPDVEQTFSERETSVAISPSESQEPDAARFHFIGSVEALTRGMCMLARYPQPVDLDKGGNCWTRSK